MNEKFGQMVASSDRKCKIRELMHDDNIDPNECSKQLMKLLVRSITKKISNWKKIIRNTEGQCIANSDGLGRGKNYYDYLLKNHNFDDENHAMVAGLVKILDQKIDDNAKRSIGFTFARLMN